MTELLQVAAEYFEPLAAGYTVKIHPAADALPMLEDDAAASLLADVKAHGLRERIKIWIDQDRETLWLVDGRNRTRAAAAAGLESDSVVEWVSFDNDAEVARYVFSLNLERRHLNSSQRAMAGARLLPMFEEAARARQGARSDLTSVPIGTEVRVHRADEEAADALNTSARSVARAKKVLTDAPELAPLVDAGQLSVSAAAALAKEDEDLRLQVLEEIQSGLAPQKAIAKAKPHVSHNSGDNEWYTPAPFIKAAREAMGGIDVDPASCPLANETVEAAKYYTAEDDGLTRPWVGRVWLNPPYAQPLIRQFCEGLVKRYQEGEVRAACVLVNNGTETAWGQALLSHAAAVCFPKSRIKFYSPEGTKSSPLQGQLVAYFGDDAERFAKAFAELGEVLYAKR
jgi:ParB-like chromosome segregation protein Spo0J